MVTPDTIYTANLRAGAAKRGRRPEWPYVPIIDHGEQVTGVHRTRTEQIKGKAFASREEAVAYAERVIESRRLYYARRLADPRERALRQHLGMPEISRGALRS